MAGGRSPINQNNSLPIFSVSQYVTSVLPPAPPTFSVTNAGKTQKVWSPSDCGINGSLANAGDPRTAGSVFLLTNRLDLTGLTQISIQMVGNVTAAGGDTTTQAWNIYLVPVVANPIGGAELIINPQPPLSNDNMTGTYAQVAFPKMATLTMPVLRNAGPWPYQKMCSTAFGLGDNALGVSNVGGIQVARLFFFSGVGQDPINLFVTIWGQG